MFLTLFNIAVWTAQFVMHQIMNDELGGIRKLLQPSYNKVSWAFAWRDWGTRKNLIRIVNIQT